MCLLGKWLQGEPFLSEMVWSRSTKDPADSHCFVVVVLPSQVFLIRGCNWSDITGRCCRLLTPRVVYMVLLGNKARSRYQEIKISWCFRKDSSIKEAGLKWIGRYINEQVLIESSNAKKNKSGITSYITDGEYSTFQVSHMMTFDSWRRHSACGFSLWLWKWAQIRNLVNRKTHVCI